MVRDSTMLSDTLLKPKSANVGNALIYGLPEDLGLQGIQTNAALAVFFAAYIIFEIPANVIMKKLKPHIFCKYCIIVLETRSDFVLSQYQYQCSFLVLSQQCMDSVSRSQIGK